MSNKIVRNTVYKTLLTVLNIVVPILVGPYIARVLDVELYAYYNQALSVLAWFIPFATFGIYNYAIREISYVKHDQRLIETNFSKFFFLCLITTGLTCLAYVFMINSLVDKNIVYIYYILTIELIAQAFNVEWMNEANENYSFILIKTIIIKIVFLFSVFIFVREATSIKQYTLIATLSVFFNYFVSFIYIKSKYTLIRINLKDIRELIKPLLVMLILTNANMLFTYLDRLFLVIANVAVVQSSYYHLSLSIASLITQVIASIIVVTIPRLSRTLIQDINEYKTVLNNSVHYFFMIGLPILFGLSALGPEIMRIYGGDKYIIAGVTLQILAIRMIPCLFDRVLASQMLFINGKEKQMTRMYFISGIINLILNTILFFTNIISANSLIITTLISECILIFMEWKEVKKLTHNEISFLDKNVNKYFAFSFLMFLILISLKNCFLLSPVNLKIAIINCICCIFVGAFAYMFGLIITKDQFFRKIVFIKFGK